MVVLVVVLLLTNLVTLGLLLARRFTPPPHPTPDERVADLLDRTARPPVVPGATRRVISIEILNTIELAGTRGRMAGLAGSLLPGLTRRFVYDEAVRTIRRQLTEERVVADVRVHQLRPPAPSPGSAAPTPARSEAVGGSVPEPPAPLDPQDDPHT